MSRTVAVGQPARWRRELLPQQQPKVTVSSLVLFEMSAHGLRQGDLAALLDLSQTSISHRMTGRAPWQTRDLLALDLLFDRPRGWHLTHGRIVGAAV